MKIKAVQPLAVGSDIQAAKDSVPKLDPRKLWRNPVMFAVELGAILTTLITAT